MVRGKPGPKPGPKAAPKEKPEAAPAKPPKGAKEPKPPKADNPRSRPGGNKVTLSDDDRRASFLQFNSQITSLRAKRDAAEKLLKDAFSDAKEAGFPKKQFEIARLLGDPKGEQKVKSEVGDRLMVARWMGHPLGAQMDLFEQPDRTPIVDRAYDEGKSDSMSGRPRNPNSKYSPDTDAYRAYMAGFDDDQRRLQGGFQKLDPPRSDEIENQVARRAERETPVSSSDALAANGVGEDDDDDFGVMSEDFAEEPAGEFED